METSNIAPAEIRAELARQGMSRDDLADASGIAPRTLARRLNRINPEPFRLDELDAIAAVLGRSTASLLRPPAAQAA